jgi:hypothetical protein
VKSWFFAALRESHPELTEKYGELYWRSGYVPESYKRPLLERIRKQLAARGLSEYAGDPDKRRESHKTAQAEAAAAAAACAPVQLTLF